MKNAYYTRAKWRKFATKRRKHVGKSRKNESNPKIHRSQNRTRSLARREHDGGFGGADLYGQDDVDQIARRNFDAHRSRPRDKNARYGERQTRRVRQNQFFEILDERRAHVFIQADFKVVAQTSCQLRLFSTYCPQPFRASEQIGKSKPSNLRSHLR